MLITSSHGIWDQSAFIFIPSALVRLIIHMIIHPSSCAEKIKG
ncbi:MAG: hypothetical protein MjAS7_1556 [Metallosphaera javensis (ex Sakai et al. 2022)]|nr:MAG: hypothetical protein MjAS7_1556 [Metallosphaera javensis (ex Sakai et al. 2022)]